MLKLNEIIIIINRCARHYEKLFLCHDIKCNYYLCIYLKINNIVHKFYYKMKNLNITFSGRQ
jgi:hypothetical protein